MSARREARRKAATTTQDAPGIPRKLAAGPRTDLWGKNTDDLLGARQAWRDARDQWARAHGLAKPRGHIDYRGLPSVLRDRAPYRPEAEERR